MSLLGVRDAERENAKKSKRVHRYVNCQVKEIVRPLV